MPLIGDSPGGWSAGSSPSPAPSGEAAASTGPNGAIGPTPSGRLRSDSAIRVRTHSGHSTDTPTRRADDPEVEVQRLGQRHHRVLGGEVGRHGGAGQDARRRGGVDDVALALLDHAGHERPDAVGDAEQVHLDDPPPAVGGHGPGAGRRRRPRRCCTARGRYRSARRWPRPGPRPPPRRARRSAPPARRRRRCPPAMRLGRRVERLALDVGQHHPHALAREPPRQRQADARRRARDHRDLAREVVHRRRR